MKCIGSLWKGEEWETALNKHSVCSDCYFEIVYKDLNCNSLIKDAEFEFAFYRLLGYGNRFKRHTTKIPTQYYNLIEELRIKIPEKFKKVNEQGRGIKEEYIK